MMIDTSIKINPFIKWAGGKQALRETISNLFPKDYETYYEPFIGGGSLFFRTAPTTSVIADYNWWLISTYKALKQDWKSVASRLDQIPNTKEHFLKVRSTDPQNLSTEDQAAMFIYLNKTCFRGLFRVNKKGMFNVPYGDYKRKYYDPQNLERVSEQLQNTEIRQGDFEISLYDIGPDDFVYFDPPYYKLGGYSDFNRYTPIQFSEAYQLRLAALCRELDCRGVKWALSNSYTPFILNLYTGFNIHEINARREINLNSKKRNIKELLITNYKV